VTVLAAHAHVVVRTAADAVILIRRVRQGRVYYLVPGTEVLEGETPGAAAARVARNELGIEVSVDEMLYAQAFAGVDHFFFMATALSELLSDGVASGRDNDDWELERELGGSYEIVQLPRTLILAYDVRPWALARRVAGAR
jgi:8-oxo-dGTP diphosphatase